MMIPHSIAKHSCMVSCMVKTVVTVASRTVWLALLLPLVAAAFIAGCGSPSSVVRPALLNEDEVKRTGLAVIPWNELNTPADEFGAAIPLDTTVVYFTSNRTGAPGKHSLFVARQSRGGVWLPAQLAPQLNNALSNGVPSVMPSGQELYFAGCDYGLGDCDLYQVDAGPRGTIPPDLVPWMIPKNLGLPVNSPFWDSQPCVGGDGSVLWFSSDRPGGAGGRDIWFCRRTHEGAWGQPINAGSQINTAFDEVSPWISPDHQTLVFGSNGHPGLGGFDLFTATFADDTADVRNIGAPVNSKADEISFTLSSNGRIATFASNRTNGTGGYDLYRVAPVPFPIDPIVVVQGRVTTTDSQPLFGSIEVVDLATSDVIGATITNPETGEYAVVLPRGRRYAITGLAPGHLFYSQELNLPYDLEATEHLQMNFQLQPLNGSTRLLVFFDFGQSLLKRESIADLDRVVRLLRENPEFDIAISGHTDNVGDPASNVELSQQRAAAVKSYLVGNRVVAGRIASAGYGETRPIATNATDNGRALNRRVEMQVVEQAMGPQRK
jgi:outer membrane protein OmpA-like peptidoglycan-associated protein